MTTKRLIAGAGAVVLIIFVIATINWIGIQQNRIDSLRSDIYNLQDELTVIIEDGLENAKQQILDEVTRQNSNVFDASYTVTDYNKAKNLAYVTVNFAMKEYKTSDTVTVLFTRGGESQSVSAANKGGIFTAGAALTIDSETDPVYTYSVSYRMGADEISGGQIMDIRPGDDLYDRIIDKETQIYGWEFEAKPGLGKIDIYSSFQNYFGSNEKLKFVTSKLYVTVNEKVVETVDLMDRIRIHDGYQVLNLDDSFEFSLGDVRAGGDDFSDEPYGAYVAATDGYGFEYIM